MSSFSKIEIDGSEDIYTIRWSSTRLGSMNTGFSMTISGVNIEGKKTIKGKKDGIPFTLGDDKGVIVSIGESLSRNNYAEATVVSDPFGQFLEKIIVIKTNNADGVSERLSGLIQSSNKIRFIDTSDFESALMDNYYSGDIKGFIEKVIGDIPVVIDYSNVEKSPIVKTMKKWQESVADSFENDPVVMNMSNTNSVTTVGDIINKYISPIGLEFYYIGNGKYELTTPKMTHSENDDIIEISEDNVIEFNSSIDPHSAPDIVIPELPGVDFLGSYIGGGDIHDNALERSIQDSAGNSGYVKIKTYRVPSMFYNVYENAMLELKSIRSEQEENESDNGEGVPTESNKRYEYVVRTFYQEMAQKSSLMQVQTGSAVLDFTPEITHGYQWFRFKGKKYFMGSVEHSLTRNNSNTTLQIIGAEGDFKALNPIGQVNTPENDKTKEIKTDSIEKLTKTQSEIKKSLTKKKIGKKQKECKESEVIKDKDGNVVWGGNKEWLETNTCSEQIILGLNIE